MESGGEREDMSGEWRRKGGYEWRVSEEGVKIVVYESHASGRFNLVNNYYYHYYYY